MNAGAFDPIVIGKRRIGDGCPVFIIAEIGYNFRNIDEAKASIDAAAECGADAVKFQTFRAETIVSKGVDFPKEAGASNQFDEFKQYEISEDTHRILFAHSLKKGIIPFSTPSFYDDVELLERQNMPIYKIGSDDLTNLPFIKYIAEKKKPLIFSSGMATLAEVSEALAVIRSTGNNQVILLQCVSNYPIQDFSLINLKTIPAMRQALGVMTGFSDHTASFSASLGAVALGAVAIERHFTLDKKMPVPDAFFSADPADFKQLVQSVRELEKALGDGAKRPMATEQDMRSETRKSVIARKNIKAGEKLTKDNTIVKRPAAGIPPKFIDVILGRTAKQDILMDTPITWEKLL